MSIGIEKAIIWKRSVACTLYESLFLMLILPYRFLKKRGTSGTKLNYISLITSYLQENEKALNLWDNLMY